MFKVNLNVIKFSKNEKKRTLLFVFKQLFSVKNVIIFVLVSNTLRAWFTKPGAKLHMQNPNVTHNFIEFWIWIIIGNCHTSVVKYV